jgi:ATP-dependent RNA helicase DDX59
MNLTESLGITVPTPVQMQAIPCVYLQRDVLICANTGSGKTLSFLLPIIKLISIHQSVYPVAVILAPVRELCIQIEEVAKFLMRGVPNMRTALVVGGLPIANQIHRLKQQVQIVIATPARLLDVIRNHNSVIDLSKIHVMILDEADSLLELGFEPQVHELLQSIPMKRQIVLASATIPKRIEDLAKDLLHAPITVTVGEPTLPAEGIRHIVLWESETLKKKRLFTILRDSKLFDPPVVVFVTSRVATLLLAEAIDKTLDIPTMAVHGDMPQDRRMKILQDFKDQKYSILVATGGLVGRGLDLPLCKQVIVFDFPSSIHDYIHQIGRCARLGSVGRAITFINDTNKKSFLKLVKLLEPMGVQLPSELTHSPHLRDQMGRQHRAKLTQSHEKDTCSRETLMAMIQGKEQDKKK